MSVDRVRQQASILAAVLSFAMLLLCGRSTTAQLPPAEGLQQARPIVLLGDAAHRPLQFLDNGVPRGLYVDMLAAIGKAIGREIQFELLPWGQPTERFDKQIGDGIGGVIVTAGRRWRYAFSLPFANIELSLFTRDDFAVDGEPADPAALRNRPVAVAASGMLGQILRRNGFTDVREAPSHRAGFKMVATGEVDAMAAPRWSGAMAARSAGIDSIQPLDQPLANLPVAIALRRGDALIEDLDRGIQIARNSGALQQIRERWRVVQAQSLPQRASHIVSSWSRSEGLPVDSVYRIMRDRSGYLWVATSGGVVRFDGQRFIDPDDSGTLPRAHTTALHEGHDGTIWVGTIEHGVFRGSDNSFSRVPGIASGSKHWIRDVLTAKDGVLALAVDLYRIDPETGEASLWAKLPDDGNPIGLDADSQGNVWLRTSKALYRYRDRTFEHVADGPIDALAFSPTGTVFGASHLGLMRLQQDGWQDCRLRPVTSVQDVAFDPRGGIWLATERGILRGPPPALIGGTVATELVLAEPVRQLLADRDNTVWAAPLADGLRQLESSSVARMDAWPGIVSMCKGPEAGVVFATSEGVLLADAGGIRQWQPRIRAARGSVRSVAVCTDATMLVACGSSIFRIDGAEWQLVDTASASKGGLGVVTAGPASEWAAVGSSLLRLRGLASEAAAELPKEPTILAAAGNDVWIGTAQTVQLYCDGKLEPPLQTDASVRQVYVDAHGEAWVATYGRGLFRIGSSKVTHYTTRVGLGHDALQGVAEDDHGFVWINSNDGVFRIARSELDAFAEGRLARIESEQFRTPEGNGAATACQDSRGQLWFATTRGLATIDPQRAEAPTADVPTVIEAAWCNGTPHNPKIPLMAPPGGAAELRITYAGLKLNASDQVRYRYRLRGYHKQWIEAGSSRLATFAEVPSGDYEFEVQAGLRSRRWTSQPSRLAIHVQPALHERVWFRLAALVAALGAIWLLHRALVRSIAARNRRLEGAVVRRTTELREANKELEAFTYTVSHDLRAPLRHISHHAHILGRQLPDTGDEDTTTKLRNRIAGIDRSSRRMAQLIDDLLTLSRLSRREVVREPIDSAGMVTSVWDELTQVGKVGSSSREALKLDELQDVEADRKLLRHVWLNLLDNALKYSSTREAALIEVTSESRSGRVWFVVRDNGVGFDEAFADKLFVAFERLHSESEFSGSGVGLTICERMVLKHGGEITGSATVDLGACFAFTVDPA
ncbi:MAG: transporter substrate-binding domain-containing protein [Planctomycetota bacterium]